MTTGIDGLSTLEDSLEEVKTLQSDLTKAATTAEELGRMQCLLETAKLRCRTLQEGFAAKTRI